MNTQVTEGYRLSPQQRDLWTLQRMLPGYSHAVSAALVLAGITDDALLQNALTDVVGRYEILRTVFRRMGALQFPVQVIRPEVDVWLPSVDWSEAAITTPWPEELERIYGNFRSGNLDLENGPLIQAQLVRLPASRKAVLIKVSKLCCDKTGLHSVLAEVLQTCGGCASQQTPPLQYADISEYLNETLESENTALGRRFWTKWSDDLLPPLQPAANFISPSQPKERYKRWTIDSELAVRIEESAARIGADVADVLLACWEVVLSRYFQQEELTIGIACSGRQLEGLEDVPGAFERTLPLPCRISRERSFQELVRNAAQARSHLLQWQDYFAHDGFDSKTRTPAVTFQHAAAQALPDDGPIVTHFTADESLYPHQLKLLCCWTIKAPAFQIFYQEGALTELDASALQDQFRTLLSNAAGSPFEAVGRVSSLSPLTRNFLLHELNNTEFQHSDATYVHERFQSQARRTPSHLAVQAGKTSMTYEELEEKSSRLAKILKSRGIGPERAVAVCLERCPELLISILAVLKSGGYYIPLDLDYPAERLAFVLRDSKAALVLTKAAWTSRLIAMQVPVLTVDEDLAPAGETQCVEAGLDPHNLAYAIYTSGSTGQPKGVAISHAALSNYLSWCEHNYDLRRGGGVIVNSAVGFDLTVTTLLAPLVAGQTIILLQGDDSTEELASLLCADAQFTLIKITPAHLQLLNQILDPRRLSGAVHTIIIGGEALFSHHVAPWREHSPHTRLINEYGPTEATVGCSVHEVSQYSAAGAVPIGKPIANATLFVLDSEMEPVPLRTTGDLYIGGAGLARGYVGQAAITAARFVPNPFSSQTGDRLYKTGDLARYDADGTLQFLGRADDQVKLRGYRIELGEIEHALRQHPKVRDAAVVLSERAQKKQLVAFVVLGSSGPPQDSDLRRFLSDKLPEYMVPAQIVTLDRLPLTFNGKIDKRSLPDPDLQPNSPSRQYVAPRNTAERLLADLWAKALGLQRVGIRDNFFELGGDSIISIQIVNRARQLGLSFTPRQLFRHRSIAELVDVVKTDLATAEAPAIPLSGHVELTPIQRWFFEQNFDHPNHWNQAMLFEAHEAIVPSLLEKALNTVVERHDALRLRFFEQEASLTSPVDRPWLATLELSSMAPARQHESLENFAIDLQSGLDLAKGPVMKLGLVRKQGAKDRLLWVIHHLCVDVVSWSVLLADLAAAYRQLALGAEIDLPPETSRFEQWSLRLHQYAQSDGLRQELNYWLSRAQSQGSQLPVDFPDGDNLESSAQIAWCSLNSDETNGLLQRVPRTHHTMINDVLLAALLQAFYEWSREKALTIDLENHGREELFPDLDLSRTVGWFTCIFPITLTLASTCDCVSNLHSVKEQIRSIPNGGLGYGLLRYAAQDPGVRRALQQLPRPQVIFNYLGRSGQKTDGEVLFTRCDGVLGPSYHPRSHRAYLLEITGGINSRGELRLAFIFSRNIHRESSIQKLATGVVEALREIIGSSTREVVTPSDIDVSMAQLDGGDLNRLISKLSRNEEASE